MNWDWDKLQEKRQRQNWRPEPRRDDNREPDDGDPRGGGPNFSNPLRDIKWRIPRGGGGGLKYILLIIVAGWLLSGIYIVNPDELGVVLRFGKYVGPTVEPGPHYHLPYPIEEVYKPKVTQVQRIEVGFRSVGNARYQQGQARILPEEASMLTGDENIVNIQFSVQYQIKDPVEYLFNVTNQAAVVKNAAEAAMREVMGNSLIDSALADGKLQIQMETATLLQELLDNYQVGVRILGVQMQDVMPPDEVGDAFKDVASAREDKSRLINEADADRNELLPQARGEAARIVNEAEAYRKARVLNAEGEAQRFTAVLHEYNRAPDVTRKRMYLEAMEEILNRPGLEKLILSLGGDNAQALPLLPLDRMMSGSSSAGTPEASRPTMQDTPNTATPDRRAPAAGRN